MIGEDRHGELCEQFAKIGKTLANSHRIALLYHLEQGECSVERLARAVGLSVANTSQHLRLLRNAKLVTARRQGQHVYYGLTDATGIMRLLDCLQNLSGRLNANADHVRWRNNASSISFLELLSKLDAGEVMLMDVRPHSEFGAGHLPGAKNIPLPELDARRLPEGFPAWKLAGLPVESGATP